MKSLVELIKVAGMEAVENNKPMAIVGGEVISVNPLKIFVDQKTILTEPFLTLTNMVRDHEIELSIGGVTLSGGDPTHTHGFPQKATVTVHNGLKVGEDVIMLRKEGGQTFVVIDRGVIE